MKILHAVAAFFASVATLAHDMLFSFMSQQGLILHSVYLPNGSIIALASGYDVSMTMSAVTNANPGVATVAGSPSLADGDIIEVTSGWSKLNKKVVRVNNPSGGTIELENINTTSTTLYPVGGGAGSVRRVTGWTQLAQILESTGEGGEQQFVNYQFLESDSESRIPTFKSAAGWNLQVADDPTLAGYILAAEANEDRQPRAVRVTLPGTKYIFFSAFVTIAPMPQLTKNELAQVQVTLSFENPEPVRYSS